MERQPLSLLQLNEMVSHLLASSTDPQGYWLTAEISELRVVRGHCYLSFVQKSERGDSEIVARADGRIWARTWNILSPYFQRQTGRPLSGGMQVLVCVRISFHPLHGYALVVEDIDPTYTLGDIARRRQEILQQLEAEGVADLNKQLPLPRLLQRIAVVSAANAAGYQDFQHQLHNNPSHLAFRTRLFPAILQGTKVEESVIAALDAIAAEAEQWDAVVIIRGGGATSDLSGFDTLALAENVAQFPLPIITGIGHERDDTIIDLVAHTRVKTPTAAATFLIDHQQAELDAVLDLAAHIAHSVQQQLQEAHNHLLRLTSQLPALATQRANDARLTLERIDQHLRTSARQLFERHANRLNLAQSQLKSADPERLLRLGFSITRLDGRAITCATHLQPGQQITTTLATGTVTSIVESCTPHPSSETQQ